MGVDNGGEFPETRWSALLELDDPRNLDRLLRQYWKPVYQYVRALRPVRPDEAEDLTQQFFTRLLDRGSLARLVPGRGSFRGFLKTALRYFLVDEDRGARARAPRDGARVFPFGAADEPVAPAAGPDEAFDRAWARDVLAEAVARLRRSLLSDGKRLYAELFSALWDERPSDEKSSYAELARRHSISVNDVGNHLRVVRERLRALLREIVTEYLGPGEDPEDEVRFILSR